MNNNFEKEYGNSNDFHQKLRYFNEMISEIHSLLALEPGDIRATQDAERNLATELVRFRAANDAVEQARVALELAQTMQSRIVAQMCLVAHQGRALAQATIQTVESRPHVRPMYKSGLRGIFAGASESEPTATDSPLDGDANPLFAPAAPRFVPVGLSVSGRKTKPELRWQWGGARSETLRFEVAAAVGTMTTYRATATATPGTDFVTLGTTEPDAEMVFTVILPNTPDRPVKQGVPVTYRVRGVMINGATSEWSEPLHVAFGQSVRVEDVSAETPDSTKSGVLSALFELRRRRVQG